MITVLLVDDDPDEYELLQSAFKKFALEASVLFADCCEDLMKEFIKYKPDIILMDINLPRISGIQCLKLIRSHNHYRSVPVIMYSTSDHRSTIEESYLNEANFYIVKPGTIEGIENVIQKVLRLTSEGYLRPAYQNFVIE